MKQHKGYTLLEMVIVVSIIVILAGAALSQTSGVQKNLQFQNIFQKVVYMTQRARTLALTKGDDLYGVSITNTNTVLYKNTPATVVESQTFPVSVVLDKTVSSSCRLDRRIEFAKETAKTTLLCGASQVTTLPVKLCQVSSGTVCSSNVLRTKTFTIQSASGIPQVQ